MEKVLLISLILFFIMCYLFSCDSNIIEGQENRTSPTIDDKFKLSEDFINVLKSDYFDEITFYDNDEENNQYKKKIEYYVSLFPLKEYIIDFSNIINSLDNKNNITKPYLLDILDGSSIKDVFVNFKIKFGDAISDNDIDNIFSDISQKLSDLKNTGNCDDEYIGKAIVDQAKVTTGLGDLSCIKIDELLKFATELSNLYKTLLVSFISVYSLYIAYNNSLISKNDLQKAYNNMEFVFQLNVDNPLMNELVIANNKGSDEIRINYKELTSDIYQYFNDRTDIQVPLESDQSFNNILKIFKEFGTINAFTPELIDGFFDNPPKINSDEPSFRKSPIDSQPIDPPIQSDGTRAPGNCAMILKTATDLISSDGIHIDNSDDVARQIEECARQTGLNVDVTINQLNSVPEVTQIPTVTQMPTVTPQPSIHLFNKHPKISTASKLNNMKMPNGSDIPSQYIDGTCFAKFGPAFYSGINNVNEPRKSEIIKGVAIGRCRTWCSHNDNCNYIWVYTSGPQAGRCCPKETIDMDGGFVNSANGEFIEVK